MGRFDHRSNYTKNAGISSVVFGADSPVLEVELNEMQEIQRKQLSDYVREFGGDSISDASAVTYKNGVLSIGECFIAVNGNIIKCTGLSISMSNGQTAYLKVYEEDADPTTTLKEEGNQQSSVTVANNIKDSRYTYDTAHRTHLLYTLTLSSSNLDGASYTKIASIVNNALNVIINPAPTSSNLSEHINDVENPHGVTKEQVGLSNVPNVSTNNQTPTYTQSSTLSNVVSGEKLSVSFGKIMKAISDLISHIANTSNPHGVTKSQVGLGSVDNTSDATKKVLSASKFTTPRSINSVAFDGSANITITANPTSNTLTDRDLDEIMTAGLYFASGGNTVSNKPSGVDSFGMMVYKTAGGYITQDLIEGNSNKGKRWTRQFNGTEWSNWEYVFTTLHKPSKSDVGLGSVPNVSTNDQAPTYSQASTLATLTSGEKLSVSFGKITKAISDLISHIANKSNPHGVTKEQVGLGSVPNVTTNDQTLTYTQPNTLENVVSGEKLSTSFGKIRRAIADLITHLANKSNPHSVTKEQVSLGNVPNVTTNNQTPTYSVPTSLTALSSGETMTTSMGKLAKAVSDLISHLANKSNPHAVTKSQVGLGSVDNTSDANKPVSTATKTLVDSHTNTILTNTDGVHGMKYTVPTSTKDGVLSYKDGSGNWVQIETGAKMEKTTVDFTEATTIANVNSGELMPTLFGKIKHLFNLSLGFDDVSGTPDITGGSFTQIKSLVSRSKKFPITRSDAVYDSSLGRLDTNLKTNFAYMTDEESEGGTVPRDADTLAGHSPSYFATAEKLKLERFPVGEVVQKIQDNSNLNNYTDIGVYAIGLTSTAINVSNIPSKVAGKLIVEDSNGSSDLPLGDDASTYRYIVQTYLTYDNSGVYRRFGARNPNTNIQWGAWDRMVMGSEYDTAIAKLNSDMTKKTSFKIISFSVAYTAQPNANATAESSVTVPDGYYLVSIRNISSGSQSVAITGYIIGSDKVTVYMHSTSTAIATTKAYGTILCLPLECYS